ncbi:flocculation protein FLO11-like [Lotus japonicus]|uniref:flocculation protein FLO11-like n=1 Tax=Lotus japonicus TaxID=34305 RepID=UPI0025828CD7|nr:flocculation protein FLO11-like [Lotus japonicus]
MRKLVNFAIYDNWSMDRTKYAIKDLKPKMKIWQKIFISCIHPRTGGTDYLNATQKVIMYYISRGEHVCLSFLLFNYLKECVEKSRTTGGENKRSISYIPYGRLLSDIFTQNRLVKALFDLGLHDDLAMTIGDPPNGTKLKRMQIIEKVQIEPKEDTSEEIRQKNYPVNDFPLWSKKDNPACIMEYVRMLRREGDSITLEEFVTNLPDSPPEMPTRRAKRTISKPSDPKGKGILIEKTKKTKAASKSVVIREPVPEPSPERTPEESYEETQSDDSESSMDSSSGNQEEEVPPRKNVKMKAIIEESSDEETEENVPLVKRQRIQTAQVEEEVEQDDCEIIENVLQVIRESAEAEESTDSDVEPIGKRLKLPLKGPLQKKESGPKQTSEKISEVQRERRSKTASDPARTARPTRSIPFRESSKELTKSINLDSALVVIPEQPEPISTSLPTSTQTAPTQTEPQTQAFSQAETQVPQSNIQTATTAIPSIHIQTFSTSTTTEPIPTFNSFIQGIVQSEATPRNLVQHFSPKPPSTSKTLLITQTDQLQDVAETSYVSLSNYSAVNSRDLSFTSPEKTATSRQRQVTISEAEHMDESDHSGIEKNHVIDSTPSGQTRTHSSNASSSNATRTPQAILTLATSFRPQNLIQLIQEFSEEATRRLQWLYQVTDNQFDASFVDGLWSAF